MKNKKYILQSTYALPFIITGLSISGLVSAMLGDGSWDIFSWIVLSLVLLLGSILSIKHLR